MQRKTAGRRERCDDFHKSCCQSVPNEPPSFSISFVLPGRPARQRSLTPRETDEPLPGCIVPWPAATSPKVLRSLIPLPDLWGLGRGGGWDRSNQSPSKHTKVPLLLQLETWLRGRVDILLDWSQLHLISIRKRSCSSLWRVFMFTVFMLNTPPHSQPL